MLVCRRALGLILAEIDGISAACARLADTYRDTMMPGRTLLQQALPTTFGKKAAGWLVSVLEVRTRLRMVRESGLAVQLGGAAGTLASLGPAGTRVLGEFARELDLAEPVVPWHTDRVRISDIGCALSLVAGVVGKISQDVILMAQTEIGEVAEPAGEGRGGSSTLPHKRNPILSVTPPPTPGRYSTSRIRCRLLWWVSTSGPRARGTPSGKPFLTPSPWQVGPPPRSGR